MNAGQPRNSGGISQVSTGEMRNEQADAAGPNSQARTGTGKKSADHEQDWQPYPVDPYPFAIIICDDHT